MNSLEKYPRDSKLSISTSPSTPRQIEQTQSFEQEQKDFTDRLRERRRNGELFFPDKLAIIAVSTLLGLRGGMILDLPIVIFNQMHSTLIPQGCLLLTPKLNDKPPSSYT